ncbi:hypothetical protein K450DRAFT_257503 [Umbelopsis ramanniana AG]|uniref:Uncharacterized protein n=1 Tax=Umbelopsis ramanniana AG TaxID=1314678 RepID=A0AAD5E405_UMBRA|nr:uncharacterized protein K450DRAFT_257503 [Umbelopsis ramanniana AG]KAI8576274.1 hypothetical protein K450DRAFT_257503 [Umbelopsis ramanniana AG]
MAPAAYAKALDSTSNTYSSASESNGSHVEKPSAYAFSPSWLNNTTGSSPMRSLNTRGLQPSDSISGDSSSSNQPETMDSQVRSLSQLKPTRDGTNTFEKNFPTLAANSAEDKHSSAGSVWANRNLTKEKVISSRSSLEEGTYQGNKQISEHNVQLAKLKALVPKLETKKRTSSSRPKPNMHPGRTLSLPAQFSRSTSTVSPKSVSAISSPPLSASSTPATPKKLAVFRSSHVRQISPVETKGLSSPTNSDSKKLDQGLSMDDQRVDTGVMSHQSDLYDKSHSDHIYADDLSQKSNDDWQLSSVDYGITYSPQVDNVSTSIQQSRSETTAYLKEYQRGSERWENNCGGISLSTPTTPKKTISDTSSKLDFEDQSSLFGSRSSSPSHRSQSSVSSTSRREYSHFGPTHQQVSYSDYAYNQEPMLSSSSHTLYQQQQQSHYTNPVESVDSFTTRPSPSFDRSHQDHSNVSSIYARHDSYYGQYGSNEERHVLKSRTLGHPPINRHRPGVYHA